MTEQKKIYIHQHINENRMNEEKSLIEQFIRDGEKGLSFKMLKLSKGKKELFFKISGKELEDKNFAITIRDGEKKEEKTINKKELMALIKKHKELDFLENYMTKDMEKFRKTLKLNGGGSCHTMHKIESIKPKKKIVHNKSSKKKTKKSSKKSSRSKIRKTTKKKTKKTTKKKTKKTTKKKTKKKSKN